MRSVTSNLEQRTALLAIQQVQEDMLKLTHGSLQQWSSNIAKAVLERHTASAARFLSRQRVIVAGELSKITSSLDVLVDHTDLYELAVKMGAQTRDADGIRNLRYGLGLPRVA